MGVIVTVLLVVTQLVAGQTNDFEQFLGAHTEGFYNSQSVYGLGPDFAELVMRNALLNVSISMNCFVLEYN